MKKILQLIIFLVFANNAMAQLRTVDLELSDFIILPNTSFTNITPQDTIRHIIKIKNNGPDTIINTDVLTIVYYVGLKDTLINKKVLTVSTKLNPLIMPGEEIFVLTGYQLPQTNEPSLGGNDNRCYCYDANTIDTFFASVISADIFDPDVDTSYINYPMLAQMGSNNFSIRPMYFYSTGGGGTSLPQTDNNLEKSNALQLYPNPTQYAVNFDFVAKQLAKVEINIYDVSGKRVMHEAFQSKTSEKQTFSQPVNNLPKNNLYIVELSIDGLKKQAKLYLQ